MQALGLVALMVVVTILAILWVNSLGPVTPSMADNETGEPTYGEMIDSAEEAANMIER